MTEKYGQLRLRKTRTNETSYYMDMLQFKGFILLFYSKWYNTYLVLLNHVENQSSMKKRRLILLLALLFIVLFEVYLLWGTQLLSKPTASSISQLNECSKFESGQKLSCWEDLIDLTLKEQGLGAAFEVVDTLFKTEPSFASSCHDYVHKLGQKAYFLFTEKKDFKLSTKTSYCGYGFYHGFMETLLQKTKDMEQARKFCAYADEQLKKTTTDAGGACYHGIGHGTVDGSDPRAWGDPEAMIQPALELCEGVSSDEKPPPRHGKLFRCVSGAFNGLEILMDSSQYKLSPDRADPLSVCRSQPDRYKEACYTQFVVMVMAVSGGNFEKSAEIIDSIPEDKYAVPTLQSLAVELSHQTQVDYQKTIDFCRSLPNRFRIPCTTSVAEGFLKYGPPQNEYKEAINFCSLPLLTGEERINCFERVLSLLRNWYTAEKASRICQTVDKKYQWNGCQYN